MGTKQPQEPPNNFSTEKKPLPPPPPPTTKQRDNRIQHAGYEHIISKMDERFEAVKRVIDKAIDDLDPEMARHEIMLLRERLICERNKLD